MKNNLESLLKIKNQTETSCDLYFYGDIVDNWLGAWDNEDKYPQLIKEFLDEAVGKNINIYINSGGGSVFAGMAIYNMLKRHKGHKTVYVDGLAGSIASVIALAGDKVIIPNNAYMMIHKPWSGLYGNSNELREMANTLDKIEEGILNIYAENLVEGVELETIKEMVNNETWLTGEEASKYFNIEVSNSVEAVACTSDYFDKYNKVPSNISNDVAHETLKADEEDVARKTLKANEEDVARKTSEIDVENKAEKEMLLMELDLI